MSMAWIYRGFCCLSTGFVKGRRDEGIAVVFQYEMKRYDDDLALVRNM